MNILFWNINKRDVKDLISDFILKYKVDILVLIENNINHVELLLTLNDKKVRYNFCSHNKRGISIYSTFNKVYFEKIETESSFLSLLKFNFKDKEILFGGIHLPSKLQSISTSGYSNIARRIHTEIKKNELKLGHTNTLLVGDFNMNPFENGMVEPDAFNATMCRDIVESKERVVSGVGRGRNNSLRHLYFYNPMWSFLGDLSPYRPGTYYHYQNDIENNFRWNMLDQVLIRPALIANFDSESIVIIDKDIKGNDLINSRAKSRSKGQRCDHLPVFFSMDIN